jgi:hypothetical protein
MVMGMVIAKRSVSLSAAGNDSWRYGFGPTLAGCEKPESKRAKNERKSTVPIDILLYTVAIYKELAWR